MPSDPIPRYCPQRELPAYSYVPGLFPHPMSDERGHSYGRHEPPAQPLDESTFRTNETYGYALDLFNHGYYWEAHETWEALWHAAGRRGPAADFLKGLIKLAAAGVKAREGRPAGVRQHALRAAELVAGVLASVAANNDCAFGLNLRELHQTAIEIAQQADELAGDDKPQSDRRLPMVLRFSTENNGSLA
jgi:predicted metal-dependent hydrolase